PQSTRNLVLWRAPTSLLPLSHAWWLCGSMAFVLVCAAAFGGGMVAIKKAIITVRDNLFSIDVATAEFERTEYMCEAGVTSISIDPDGRIHPCISLKNTLGNIVDGTIRQAWNDPERYRVMEALRWDNTKECVDCSSRKYCPHCPGMSQAESGDMYACNTCDKIVSECIMEIES
ncbi:MAG: SPASM domain-containing protein, partial [Atopobiaceae bacterium]|nr:SPASM domain-containing protein [Atopobiaceae bacterium]